MKTKVKRISIAIKKQRRYIGKQLLLTSHQKEWRQEDNGTFESHKRKKTVHSKFYIHQQYSSKARMN